MIELMPHQQRAVNWLVDHKRTALFMDVGLGKTYPAIYAAPRPILIVCPRYLRYMWQDALQGYAGLDTVVVEGTADQRYSILTGEPHEAYIINYQMLTLGAGSDLKTAKFSPLFSRRWETVIADEAHYFRGRNSWWKGAKKLEAHRFYMLTGTPHVTNWGDVWPILHLIDKKQFSSYHQFVDQHLQVFYTAFNKDIGAPKSPADFRRMLDTWTLHMTYETAGRPRPEYVEEDLPVPLTEHTYAEMKLARSLWYWVDPSDHSKGKMPIPNKGALAHVLRHIIARDKNKLDLLLETLEAHEDTPVIVWTWYVETAEAVTGLIAQAQVKKGAKGAALYMVHGRMSDNARKASVDLFKQTGGILVANLAALSEGENLQAAKVQVFYEASHVGTTNHQAIGRSARTGQDTIVQVFNLVGRRSADERVLRIARNRLEAGRNPWERIAGDDDADNTAD